MLFSPFADTCLRKLIKYVDFDLKLIIKKKQMNEAKLYIAKCMTARSDTYRILEYIHAYVTLKAFLDNLLID